MDTKTTLLRSLDITNLSEIRNDEMVHESDRVKKTDTFGRRCAVHFHDRRSARFGAFI